MKLSVLVPTYRRSRDLERCLNALKQQSYPAEEILVVVRDTDDETQEFLKSYDIALLPLKVLRINLAGVVAALNLGLDNVCGDIVAITDDDAAPHPDWLEKIQSYYMSDSRVGAVGGRDWVYLGEELQDISEHPGASNVVGRLQWFGRMIGNHHIGYGEAREVDFLKGVNSSYRMSAIGNLRFGSRLLGGGAQVHHEAGFCLTLKKKSWKIIYDPLCGVDHYPASRFDIDQRNSFNFRSYYNIAYNETLVLGDYLAKYQFAVYLIWAVLVGTRGCFGLLQSIRLISSERGPALIKLIAAISGHFHAFYDVLFKHHKSTSSLKTHAYLPVQRLIEDG
jgi:glycosyltransferase involved in cell wall biosynthesis